MIETIISREICRAPRDAHKPTLFVNEQMEDKPERTLDIL